MGIGRSVLSISLFAHCHTTSLMNGDDYNNHFHKLLKGDARPKEFSTAKTKSQPRKHSTII